jgi:DEAD/DEAH box helicase domain-containing protein
MLDLAAGLPLAKQRWFSRGEMVTRGFVGSAGDWLTTDVVEGVPVLLNRGASKAVVLGHPLWRRDPDHFTEQQTLVLDMIEHDLGIRTVSMSDLYEVDRLPLSVLRRLL